MKKPIAISKTSQKVNKKKANVKPVSNNSSEDDGVNEALESMDKALDSMDTEDEPKKKPTHVEPKPSAEAESSFDCLLSGTASSDKPTKPKLLSSDSDSDHETPTKEEESSVKDLGGAVLPDSLRGCHGLKLFWRILETELEGEDLEDIATDSQLERCVQQVLHRLRTEAREDHELEDRRHLKEHGLRLTR